MGIQIWNTGKTKKGCVMMARKEWFDKKEAEDFEAAKNEAQQRPRILYSYHAEED
jgi:hypothetical protein